jgi:hypothetical protein
MAVIIGLRVAWLFVSPDELWGAVAVLERLRQDLRTRNVPVVILSSESDFDLVKDRLNLGELDHLVTEEADVRRPPHPTLLGCSPEP